MPASNCGGQPAGAFVWAGSGCSISFYRVQKAPPRNDRDTIAALRSFDLICRSITLELCTSKAQKTQRGPDQTQTRPRPRPDQIRPDQTNRPDRQTDTQTDRDRQADRQRRRQDRDRDRDRERYMAWGATPSRARSAGGRRGPGQARLR